MECGLTIVVVYCLVTKSYPTLATPWTVARQVPLSMGFSRPRILEWVSISFSRGSSPAQGLNVCLLHWQADSLPLSLQERLEAYHRKPIIMV